MGLPEDLLVQARHLAQHDRRRPKQANLRRAVSSGYYALFHYLIERVTTRLIGGGARRRGLRHLLARGFDHSEMRAACTSFKGGTLPKGVTAAVGTLSLPPELRDLATVFLDLQDLRHTADYDLSRGFSREDVLALLDVLEEAIAAFDALPDDPVKDLFLVSLLTWKRLSGRG